MNTRVPAVLVATAMVLVGATLRAQQPAPTTAAPQPQQPQLPVPAVGDMAPDFSFTPISAAGVGAQSKRLSDYRNQTVVLWFFVKARTRG